MAVCGFVVVLLGSWVAIYSGLRGSRIFYVSLWLYRLLDKSCKCKDISLIGKAVLLKYAHKKAGLLFFAAPLDVMNRVV